MAPFRLRFLPLATLDVVCRKDSSKVHTLFPTMWHTICSKRWRQRQGHHLQRKNRRKAKQAQQLDLGEDDEEAVIRKW
eukprot:879065-Amphidinium_carterae.1